MLVYLGERFSSLSGLLVGMGTHRAYNKSLCKSPVTKEGVWPIGRCWYSCYSRYQPCRVKRRLRDH
jgi:hypothetical protein